MNNIFTYNITEDRFYLNGEPITLTTDDILWASDVHASGIQPFGGIKIDTVWKKNRTLTDTMRQLIEKVVLWYPYITYKAVSINDEDESEDESESEIEDDLILSYLDVSKIHKFKLLINYHDGMYLNDQIAHCELIETSVISNSKNYKISRINNYEYIVEYQKIDEDESEDDSSNDITIVYTYGSGEFPRIRGASDEYIKDNTIQSDTKTVDVFIGLYNPIVIYTGNKIIPNPITNEFIIDLLDDKSSAVDILDPNCTSINFNNKIKDNIFIFAIPEEKKYSKLTWLYTPKEIINSDMADISEPTSTFVDYIDYSDLLEKTEIDYNGTKYFIYKIVFADNLLNKNNYTIVLE